MPDDAAAAAAASAAAAAAAAAAATPWHTGVEPEILGTWQNKGWKLDDAKGVAIEATKAYAAAQRFVGVPTDQLLRVPKADAPEPDIKAFHARLGVPEEAKGYDFNGVKWADGKELEAGFSDIMRAALHAAKVAKDNAPTVVKAVVKYFDDAKKAETEQAKATYATAKAALMKNWGPNGDFNLMKAMEGARWIGLKLGPDGELSDNAAVGLLEKSLGYAKVMEIFRKIGAGTSEDTWKDGDTPGGNVMTRDAAVARKRELMRDQAWVKRYTEGDMAAKTEMLNLNQLIVGQQAA
jgi:hypothetical protein